MANKELRYLRSCFNFGRKRRLSLIANDPTEGIAFLPVEKKVRLAPPLAAIEKVIRVADKDTADYLIAIADLLARVNEINQLVWRDVDFKRQTVTLYTRERSAAGTGSRARSR